MIEENFRVVSTTELVRKHGYKLLELIELIINISEDRQVCLTRKFVAETLGFTLRQSRYLIDKLKILGLLTYVETSGNEAFYRVNFRNLKSDSLEVTITCVANVVSTRVRKERNKEHDARLQLHNRM